MALDDIKKINDEINKLRAELGKDPLKPFDENDLERAKALFSGLSAEVREMGNDLDYVYKSFKDSVNELSKQNRYLSDARKSINGISDISKKVLDYRKGETSLDEKTLQNLKKKASSQFDELRRIKDIGNLSEKNRGEVEKALKDQELFNEEINKTIVAQKTVNKEIGLVGTGIEGISKGLSKMGFGNLSQPLTEAIEKTKNARLQILLNKEAISSNNKELEKLNRPYKFLSDAEKLRKKQLLNSNLSLKSQNQELDTQTSKYKNIGKALTSQLTKANLIDFAIQQMVDALIKADTQTGQLAKAFGTSYSEATSMRNELNTVANLSGDVNITTGALQESLIAVNKEFGTAAMLSGELLTDFTNMTKVMGYSNEAAAKLSKITTATGTDLSDNTAQILGTAAAFNVTNGLALNEKEIVEGVAKASAATTVSLGMQPGKIAAAVVQAKALGLELEQVEGIAESLLNFESSISNELEAELLTGRALNLEQARYLALTNDIEGVAKEIAKQGITATEFTGMNMIQQKAIAEAVGMTREELAQSLINQQALTNLGGKDKDLISAYNRLKKEGLSDTEIQAKLGQDIQADQLKSQSIQERFNASVEKLQEIFVSVAEPILQIVSPFMDLATTILPLVNVALTPITGTLKFLAESIQFSLGLIRGILKEVGTFLSPMINRLNPLFQGFSKFVEESKELKGTLDVIKSVVGTIAITYGAIAAYNKTAALFAGIKLIAERNTEKSLIVQGFLLAKNLIKDIASAVAKITGASATTLGVAAGIAALAGAGAYAYLTSIKDGIIDPNKGVVVSGGFGSVQLNEKDTFVGDKNGIKAGTNLFGNTFQTPPPASNNLFENIVDFFKIPPTSAAPPSITVDMAPLVNEMQAVKAVLVQILNKDSNVYLDGAKVGKGINMARTKIG
jgi:hypothetical protein